MFHNKIFEKLVELFPIYKEIVTEWFPNGKGSIIVRLKDHKEHIFIYTNDKEWSLETRDHFLDRMDKKEERSCD